MVSDALNKAKQQAIAEATQALTVLREGATFEVDQALDRLEKMVAEWEKAAERLGALSLASVAEIYLAGGAAFTVLSRKDRHDNSVHPSASSFVETALRSSSYNTPYLNVLAEKDYEIFILVTPVG